MRFSVKLIANHWRVSHSVTRLNIYIYLPCLVGFITLNAAIHENAELFARPVSELELNKTLAIWATVSVFSFFILFPLYWTRKVKKPFRLSGKSSELIFKCQGEQKWNKQQQNLSIWLDNLELNRHVCDATKNIYINRNLWR